MALDYDFSEALTQLKAGARMSRRSMTLPREAAGLQYVELQEPDAHSKMTLPYLYLSTHDGDLVPWTATQRDLLAEDWFVVSP